MMADSKSPHSCPVMHILNWMSVTDIDVKWMPRYPTRRLLHSFSASQRPRLHVCGETFLSTPSSLTQNDNDAPIFWRDRKIKIITNGCKTTENIMKYLDDMRITIGGHN